MAIVVVRRPVRTPAPELPTGELILEPPPEIPPPGGRRLSQTLMMLPMLAGSAGMALMFAGGRGGALTYVAGGMYGIAGVGMIGMSVFANAGQPTKQEMANNRRAYLRHLGVQRQRAREVIRRQRETLSYRHPDPDTLWTVVASHRLWERRPTDLDFSVVRIGLGPQDLATPLVPPKTEDVGKLEPVCAAALRRFIRTYAVVPDLPIAMALNGFARVYLHGDPDRARAVARALVAQAAAFHSPDDLLVAVGAAPENRDVWEWVKWLPHGLHPERRDRLGNLRMVAPTVASLEVMLDSLLTNRPRFDPTDPAPQLTGPHLIVIVDGAETAGSDHLMTDTGLEGVTLINLSTPPPTVLDRSSIALEVTADGRLRSRTLDGENDLGVGDQLDVGTAEALARQLAPLRLVATSRGDQPLTADLGLAELLELGDPYEFDPVTGWGPRPARARLRVPFGITPDGTSVDLDLKESAQEGMGPHGLLIGATGSGKSELLRTLVLALAVTHNPETLNLVLVDFKGGATFTKLDRLPHTSAVITNLADELPLVDRMTDALNGEIMRRQELLRVAGNYTSLWEYDKARASGAALPVVPSLLVIVDEFSELLSAKPDFIDMFVQIGRVGRSLGVHLLLASQHLEEGRLRGLDNHLSYRIGLRTFSAVESRVVLGSPDAYELPRAPGNGFLKYGTEPMNRFRAAYVSGVHRRHGSGLDADGPGDGAGVLPFSTYYVAPKVEKTGEDDSSRDDEAVGETLLDILVDRMEGKGTPAHQVWLPPLAEPPTLDGFLGPLAADSRRGFGSGNERLWGALRARIGVIDRPFEQRRDILELDLSGGAGHVAVVGGPQSGKSNAVRSLICSLALSHTPQEAQFYCLDFGGGSLRGLRDLPHVGGVAGRLDVELVRRTIAEVRTVLDQRERTFAKHSVPSIADYRRAKRDGQFTDDPFGDVFLVVDGWATVRNHFDELDQTITDIAARGLNYGVHVVVAATSWMELRQSIRDILGTRVELRLGDPNDSYLGRRAANNVPDGVPGRGITPERLHMLTALPRIDGRPGTDDLAEGVADLVARVGQSWTGRPAPRVRLLPSSVDYPEIRQPEGPHRFAVGLAESDLQPVTLDFTADPHFLLLGDTESGKTAFLRALATGIADRCTPEQARIILVDYRRGLLGAVRTDHLIAYGTSAASTESALAEAAAVMESRLPGPDVTQDQLLSRSWWTGPDLYVLVDDYDLVAGAETNPLLPLLQFLAQGRDVGLHLVVTRRTGGADRAFFDPVLGRLRELGTPGILLSGDRNEGPLLGNTKPMPLPPGRGILVTRRTGTELVQLAWVPPRR
ncbi:type VII secretion protein EccC [Amycolatopsis taiwanensis]|uniref:Type VII secretion protein EccC n=1 Tax=Amycolatopsis taiwanensis TaxID=342230 RepID=A0A9W6QXT1_9PSEU|nr:type VII secretion protein EccC [Amycolatopsis taiwanensis]GLY64726.1 type VII secretion protein EccC [Amycolatopsis taiwanensis]